MSGRIVAKFIRASRICRVCLSPCNIPAVLFCARICSMFLLSGGTQLKTPDVIEVAARNILMICISWPRLYINCNIVYPLREVVANRALAVSEVALIISQSSKLFPPILRRITFFFFFTRTTGRDYDFRCAEAYLLFKLLRASIRARALSLFHLPSLSPSLTYVCTCRCTGCIRRTCKHIYVSIQSSTYGGAC